MNNTLGRLQAVLDEIEDPNLNKIIDEVFKIEISYRSMEAKNFPRQKVRDVIEDVARVIEHTQLAQSDEVTKA
jgi:allophanate hydrolase subunit 1